jgi:cytoskeletal protein RodZ
MSDIDLLSPLKSESPPAPKELITTAGSLRALRIARGLSIEDVCARLKFSTKHIEALESESFDSLPRGLALKTLVKNYARLLGVDSNTIENALQPYIGQVTGGIAEHTSTRTLGAHHTEKNTTPGSSLWLFVIFCVVIAALGIAIWQGIFPASWIPGWLLGAVK